MRFVYSIVLLAGAVPRLANPKKRVAPISDESPEYKFSKSWRRDLEACYDKQAPVSEASSHILAEVEKCYGPTTIPVTLHANGSVECTTLPVKQYWPSPEIIAAVEDSSSKLLWAKHSDCLRSALHSLQFDQCENKIAWGWVRQQRYGIGKEFMKPIVNAGYMWNAGIAVFLPSQSSWTRPEIQWPNTTKSCTGIYGCYFKEESCRRARQKYPNVRELKRALSLFVDDGIKDKFPALRNPFVEKWGALLHQVVLFDYWWQLSDGLKLVIEDRKRAAGITTGEKCIGMHVRHGDACVGKSLNNRKCTSFGDHLDHAVKIYKKYGYQTIVLMTDDPTIESNLTNGKITYGNVTFKVRMQKINRWKYDVPVVPAVPQNESERKRDGAKDWIENRYRGTDNSILTEALTDVELVSQCHAFVGDVFGYMSKLTLFRMIAIRGYMVPFVSVADVPFQSVGPEISLFLWKEEMQVMSRNHETRV